MLNYLEFTHVGPAPQMRLDFAPRLNLLTGNNSLGKSFVLDAAWWALTQTWPESSEGLAMARPMHGHWRDASIQFSYDAKTTVNKHTANFDPKEEAWALRKGRPSNPGLVLYVRVDGGFSLWDPARNYYKRFESRGHEDAERLKAFHFQQRQVWEGLRKNGSVPCEGLLSDWKAWKDRGAEEYGLLRELLRLLSPHETDLMQPDGLVQLSPDDVREIPTVRTAYGTVPVTLASAGMKRILALAYLITWAYTKHLSACKILGDEPTDRFTVLIDEVELHLHPQWQRVLLPAVLGVIRKLGRDGAFVASGSFPSIQIIASTHSPLVMASVEPHFNEDMDSVFHFDIEEGQVVVEDLVWSPQGDAVGWLVSDVFGLEQARSREAEMAIEAAEAFMRGDRDALPQGLQSQESIHQELLHVLPGHDPFWPRWIVKTGAQS